MVMDGGATLSGGAIFIYSCLLTVKKKETFPLSKEISNIGQEYMNIAAPLNVAPPSLIQPPTERETRKYLGQYRHLVCMYKPESPIMTILFLLNNSLTRLLKSVGETAIINDGKTYFGDRNGRQF